MDSRGNNNPEPGGADNAGTEHSVKTPPAPDRREQIPSPEPRFPLDQQNTVQPLTGFKRFRAPAALKVSFRKARFLATDEFRSREHQSFQWIGSWVRSGRVRTSTRIVASFSRELLRVETHAERMSRGDGFAPLKREQKLLVALYEKVVQF